MMLLVFGLGVRECTEEELLLSNECALLEAREEFDRLPSTCVAEGDRYNRLLAEECCEAPEEAAERLDVDRESDPYICCCCDWGCCGAIIGELPAMTIFELRRNGWVARPGNKLLLLLLLLALMVEEDD